MNKKTYTTPTSNVVAFASEKALLSLSNETNVVISNDNDKTVSESADLWSNKRSDSPIWGSEE